MVDRSTHSDVMTKVLWVVKWRTRMNVRLQARLIYRRTCRQYQPVTATPLHSHATDTFTSGEHSGSVYSSVFTAWCYAERGYATVCLSVRL